MIYIFVVYLFSMYTHWIFLFCNIFFGQLHFNSIVENDVDKDVDYTKDEENTDSEDEHIYRQYLAKVRRYESLQVAKNANIKCKAISKFF